MKKSLAGISIVICLLVLALAASAQSSPIVRHAIKHDLSQSLREMVAATPRPQGVGNVEIEPPRFTRPLPIGPGASSGRDSALQTTALPLVNTVPGLNFAGVGANGFAPPDTNGSIGATQFFQITNVEFAIYDKTSGNILLGPALIHSLWNGFGGDCDTNDGGDPVVLWDKAAQRWIVSQLSGTYTNWCMAVSTSSDATGTYYRYAFSSGGNLDDYPKVGVWPDAYYRATNTFQGGSSFIGANACALDRALMLSGGNANEICMQQPATVASLLPSDVDGNTAPPAGEPNFFVELFDTSDLGLFKFHVDFTNPSNSTFTGPTTIPVASYTEAGGIPQPSGGSTLDSLGDRLMFRLAYRNFGDHEALVVNHSVIAGSGVVGARWYEIRSPNATPTLFQQGTFAPDTTYRWMGSIAMDLAGDIALGYSVSSSSLDPGIRYTGRTAGDPLGSMETEASIIAGGGVQNGGLSRWGDYSSMSVDPIDDCTFWYTQEYIATTGSFNWSTQIASFKFPNCGSTNPDFYLTANPGSQTVVQGKSTTYSVTVNPLNGYANTVNLSVSGCPTGATCSVSPSSVGPPYASSTLTVSTSSTTPGGNYTLTVSGTDGTLTHTTSVSLVVISPDFSITANTKVETIKAGASAKFPFTITPLNTFTGNVTLTVTGLPSGSTGTFSPNPLPVTYPNPATSALTVTTRHKTAATTYVLTITGTSGTTNHSTTVSLTVTAH